MESGKLENSWEYTYTIKDYKTLEPKISGNTFTLESISNVSSTIDCYPYYTYYPVTIYMYQIYCPKPRCKGIFWGEVDKVVVCPKCTSRVKINREPPADYEVQVG
jgi:hypothetical protein